MKTDTEALPLDKLVDRGIYRVSANHFSIAAYNGRHGFVGIREEYGQKSLWTEYYDDPSISYGSVLPYELIGQVPEGINIVAGKSGFSYQNNKVLQEVLTSYILS